MSSSISTTYSTRLPAGFKILILLRVAIINVPILSLYSSFIINGIIVFLILIMTMSLLRHSITNYLFLILPITIVTITDYVFKFISGGNVQSIVLFLYGILQFLIWPLALIAVIKSGDYKFAKSVLITYMLCYIITGVTTYIGCESFPGASRTLAAAYHQKDFEIINLYNRVNICGFDFIYTLVLFVPLSISVIKNRFVFFKGKILLVWVLLIGMFFVILKSEYFTAIILYSVSFICFLFSKNTTSRRFWTIIILCILLVVVFISFIPVLFGNLSSLTESKILSNKFEDVGSILSGGFATSGDKDTEGRINVYLASWQAFLSSPIIGTGKNGGGHSFILDYLAKYGLVGLLLEIYLFRKIFKFSVKPFLNAISYPFFLFVFILQIIMAFLNPMILYDFFLFALPLFACVSEPQCRERFVATKR